jgi:DNA-binding HxlR family transcriptional regulator
MIDIGYLRKNAQFGTWRSRLIVANEMGRGMKTPKPESQMVEPGWEDYGDCRLVLEILDRIGDKWTVMVVGALSKGRMRFNAIMRVVDGVSHRMLTLTLRSLERDGLVTRTAYATIPPKVEYELTDLGRSLIEPLKAVAGWAQRNRPAIETARARFEAQKAEAD